MHQQRQEWEFNYTAVQLLEGAKNKVVWHKSRLNFWLEKQNEIKKEIGKNGIVIDEGAGGDQYLSSNVRGPTARIDAKLQDHLRSATQKVMEHRDRVFSYEGWVKILGAQDATNTYACKHGDWMFFFGNVEVKRDEEYDDNF